jgi:hypothetical protein
LAIEVGKNKSKRKLEIWQNDGTSAARTHIALWLTLCRRSKWMREP